MKRNIVFFAIFITAIFFYPVFAHAQKIGHYVEINPLPASVALFGIGAALLITAGFTKRMINS